MKKIIIIALIICQLIFPSCARKKDNLVQLGVECEITDVNKSDKILTIIGAGSGREIIQQESKIDCKDLEKDVKIVEFNSSNEPNILKFDDLKQSDRIKINVDEKELKNDNKFLKVKQIELIRKN